MIEPGLPHLVGIQQVEPCGYDRAAIEQGLVSALAHIGLTVDPAHPARGPLASLVSPGDTVVLKPNMVGLQASFVDRGCLVTHAEVVRAAALLAAEALAGSGRLVVADGPHSLSDFSAAASLLGLDSLRDEVADLHGIGLEVVDLRADPLGYAEFDLGRRSEFREAPEAGRFRSNDDDPGAMRSAHGAGRHSYRLAGTVLTADVLINLPKMKTHQKTGVTLALKNLVGIAGDRGALPHFTTGGPGRGGDEGPDLGWRPGSRRTLFRVTARLAAARRLKGLVRRALRRYDMQLPRSPAIAGGNWHGNDTAWRMVLDLNKLFFHGRRDGALVLPEAAPGERKHRMLTIVDGVVAGEGNGPIMTEPRPLGLLAAGLNPVAVDTACSLVMGFDPGSIEMIRNAWTLEDLPLVGFSQAAVRCASNVPQWNGGLAELAHAPHCALEPCSGWKGHIERRTSPSG